MSCVMLLAVIAFGAVHAESNAASPRIGFLSPGTMESTAPVLSGLRQGLREHGYIEGTNVTIEPRFANGQFDRLPELARELISLPVAVLVTFVTEASIAARDNFVGVHGARIAASAAKACLPSVSGNSAYAEAGGLMAYGPSFHELARSAGGYVAKILKGAKPADLPVERPTKFELVINLKTARQMGVTLPQSLLLRADRVIE